MGGKNRRVAAARFFATVFFKLLNLGTLILGIHTVHKLMLEWRHIFEHDLEVYTISLADEGLFGPVHILVPTNCTDLAHLQGWAPNHAREHGHFGLIEERHGHLPHERAGTSPAPVSRAPGIAVVSPSNDTGVVRLEVCGEVIESQQLTYGQKYFSMWWLSQAISPSTGIGEIQRNRQLLPWMFLFMVFVWWIVHLCLDFSLVHNALQFFQKDYAGVTYTKVTRHSSKTLVEYLMDYLRIFPKKVGFLFFSLSQQAALISMFVAYWDRNHFVIQYIPGCGFVAVNGVLAIMLLLVLTKTRCPLSSKSSSCCVCLHATLSKLVCGSMCLLVPLVVVPMIVWMFYNLNFLFQHSIQIRSDEHIKVGHAVKDMRHVLILTTLIHLLEAIVAPALELYHAK